LSVEARRRKKPIDGFSEPYT